MTVTTWRVEIEIEEIDDEDSRPPRSIVSQTGYRTAEMAEVEDCLGLTIGSVAKMALAVVGGDPKSMCEHIAVMVDPTADEPHTNFNKGRKIPVEATGWQPFDKAPVDRDVLAYREDAGVIHVRYVSDDSHEGGHWFDESGYEDLTGDLPTHFMEMPAGPQLATGTDRPVMEDL